MKHHDAYRLKTNATAKFDIAEHNLRRSVRHRCDLTHMFAHLVLLLWSDMMATLGTRSHARAEVSQLHMKHATCVSENKNIAGFTITVSAMQTV